MAGLTANKCSAILCFLLCTVFFVRIARAPPKPKRKKKKKKKAGTSRPRPRSKKEKKNCTRACAGVVPRLRMARGRVGASQRRYCLVVRPTCPEQVLPDPAQDKPRPTNPTIKFFQEHLGESLKPMPAAELSVRI